MGPTGPRWVPSWPHELCYLGMHCDIPARYFMLRCKNHFYALLNLEEYFSQTAYYHSYDNREM